jgi:hypothetical protein
MWGDVGYKRGKKTREGGEVNFDDYWDDRVGAKQGPFSHNAQIMKFVYSEARHLYEHMMENLRQAELRAVKAEMELAVLKREINMGIKHGTQT